MPFLPGEQYGNALTDLIFGDVVPQASLFTLTPFLSGQDLKGRGSRVFLLIHLPYHTIPYQVLSAATMSAAADACPALPSTSAAAILCYLPCPCSSRVLDS